MDVAGVQNRPYSENPDRKYFQIIFDDRPTALAALSEKYLRFSLDILSDRCNNFPQDRAIIAQHGAISHQFLSKKEYYHGREKHN